MASQAALSIPSAMNARWEAWRPQGTGTELPLPEDPGCRRLELGERRDHGSVESGLGVPGAPSSALRSEAAAAGSRPNPVAELPRVLGWQV